MDSVKARTHLLLQHLVHSWYIKVLNSIFNQSMIKELKATEEQVPSSWGSRGQRKQIEASLYVPVSAHRGDLEARKEHTASERTMPGGTSNEQQLANTGTPRDSKHICLLCKIPKSTDLRRWIQDSGRLFCP